MKKKTMGVLLTALLLSVYGISAYANEGGNPFDEIWDYINSVINPTLEDHEDRITALEGSGEPPEPPEQIKIGMTVGGTYHRSPLSYEETVIFAGIVAEDINQYVENLGLDMTFDFIVKDNQDNDAIALDNTMLFKVTGIDLIVGHPWSGQCLGSLNYVNTNNMLLISGSSTDPNLAIPNDRLFRTCPNDGESTYASAEMWETWGVEAVLTMQADEWGSSYENFEDELEIRGIQSLGRIVYYKDDYNYEDELIEANAVITQAITEYGVERVGIQFLSWEEIVQLQTQAAEHPNLIDIIWMTTDQDKQWMLDEAQFGTLAVQTRHFSPVMRSDEPFFLNQEFAEKFYELTGYTPRYYVQMQYDACWLLAETIIKQTVQMQA